MGYKLKRILMWVNQVRLPSEYQEVEYIQSTGTQWINTGLGVNQNTIIECKVNMQPGATYQYPRVYGVRNSGTGGLHFGLQWDRDNKYFYAVNYSNDGDKAHNIQTGTLEYNTDYTIKQTNTQLRINGVLQGTVSASTYSISYPLWLFNDEQAGSDFDRKANMKLYRLKMYNGTTLQRDFVPCYRKSDGVIGLYDLVNSVFYTNSGTGTFTKGSDVNMVEKQVYPAGWKPGANTLAYRPLESNANDIVGGYNGTSISGISYDTLASGKKVAKITSSTSNISISGSIAGIIGSGDYTISYWIYMTGAVLSGVGLMFWVGTNSSPYSGPQIFLDVEGRWSAGALRFSTQYGNGVSSSSKNLLNNWHYITFTRESGACKGYIDGVLEGSFTSSTALSSGNVGWLFARGTSNQCLASNSMGSEFILENKARTTQEIAEYYNQTKSNYGL